MEIQDLELSINVSKDKLVATVDSRIPQDDLGLLKEALEQEIQNLKLAPEALKMDLMKWVRDHARDHTSISGAVLHRGKEPKLPQDGSIEWTRDFFREGFYTDPDTGAIDYRRRAAENEVEQDQLLARIIPPVEGKMGIDVFGKPIPVKKPKKATIKAGDHVHCDENNCFYASGNGRVLLKHTVLSVAVVLTIEEDVGLKTGHIKHNGSVVVKGDILEGSEVEAEGEIEVMGVVENSNITAGSSFVVHGGITSAEGYKIKTDDSVQAKFLLDANIEAGGNVVIEKEILHSHIKTHGKVVIPKGRIVGGEITALAGLEAGDIGSEAEVPTHITLGNDFLLSENLAEPTRELSELRSCREKIEGAIKPIIGKEHLLSSDQQEGFRKLLLKAQEIDKDISGKSEEIDSIVQESSDAACAETIIHNQVFPNASFTIHNESHTIQDSFLGPIKVERVCGSIEVRALEDDESQTLETEAEKQEA